MLGSASTLAALVAGIQTGGIRVVDLTQPLHASTPILPLPAEFGQTWRFELHEISKYDARGANTWYWNNFKTGEHTGTHFDAPIHWITGKDYPNNATDTIPPAKFVAPACVMDCVKQSEANPDFLMDVDFVKAWEKQHGRIPAGAWILMRTDWAQKRPDEARYINAGADGPHTPGPAPDLVTFLIKERDVMGFGNEAVGTDAGQSITFKTPLPCHTGMHGANKYGLASITNLDQLPPTGAVIIAAPLKIVGGSGSPCRVIALVPEKQDG
jgi:kynurenine formamidase